MGLLESCGGGDSSSLVSDQLNCSESSNNYYSAVSQTVADIGYSQFYYNNIGGEYFLAFDFVLLHFLMVASLPWKM